MGEGTPVGQTELTPGQLAFFIAGTSAIDIAFQERQAVNAAVEIQSAEGFSTPWSENMKLFGPSSMIGFTAVGSLTCKDIDAAPATRIVTSIANINTPPAPNQ